MQYDIVILGAGPVGQSCVLLLAKYWPDPTRIAIIDAKTAAQSTQDPRTLALSFGSRQILDRISAWPNHGYTPIKKIHISHRGHFGRTLIEHDEYTLPALGYVIPYGILIQHMQHQLAQSGVHLFRPLQVLGTTQTQQGCIIQTATGEIATQWIIHAEGGVFQNQNHAEIHHDYNQQAIVTFVTCNELQEYTAYERFTHEGPLALLPHQFQGQTGYALVWCCRPEHAQQLLAQSETEFLNALQQAFGDRVGKFQSTKERIVFPLGLNLHETLVEQHSIRIGNAAQTLHPVAGQGLNLGLRDAFLLTQLLHTSPAIAPEMLAQKYQTQRQRDRKVTQRLTDLLATIFTGNTPVVAPCASIGMAALDLFPLLKKPLALQMIFGQR